MANAKAAALETALDAGKKLFSAFTGNAARKVADGATTAIGKTAKTIAKNPVKSTVGAGIVDQATGGHGASYLFEQAVDTIKDTAKGVLPESVINAFEKASDSYDYLSEGFTNLTGADFEQVLGAASLGFIANNMGAGLATSIAIAGAAYLAYQYFTNDGPEQQVAAAPALTQ